MEVTMEKEVDFRVGGGGGSAACRCAQPLPEFGEHGAEQHRSTSPREPRRCRTTPQIPGQSYRAATDTLRAAPRAPGGPAAMPEGACRMVAAQCWAAARTTTPGAVRHEARGKPELGSPRKVKVRPRQPRGAAVARAPGLRWGHSQLLDSTKKGSMNSE